MRVGNMASLPQPVHFKHPAKGKEIEAAAKAVNELWLTGAIGYQKALNLKRDLLSFVVVSHQPTISNLFLF